MNTGTRLGLYGAGLVVAFGGAFGIASAAVPESTVAGWSGDARTAGNDMQGHGENKPTDSASAAAVAPDSVKGLSAEAAGYLLSPVQSPGATGEPGTLGFQILDPDGKPVTEYQASHDRDLHLIVARADGSGFRHVHPVLDEATGTWTTPWEWAEAGTYRVFADFRPASADTGATSLTLSRTVQVAGEFTPSVPQPARVDEVDGFTVSVDGDLAAGTTSELSLTVTRAGAPVTTLEPYLGAFGHLVALREGDLAYLHVHAAEEARAGQATGPEIRFAAEVPTAGRYLLYLDFQVDGRVHTAEFVLDAAPENGSSTSTGSNTSTAPATEPHLDEGH